MPSLPRYDQSLNASANGRIVQMPDAPADTAVADALTQAGKVGLEIATRAQASKVEGEVVDAENTFRTSVDRYRSELEADKSVADEEIETRLREYSTKAMQEAGSKISSGRSRDMWMGSAERTLIENDGWARKQVAARQIDRTRARHVTASSFIESRAGDASLTEQTFGTMIAGQKALVEQDRKRGFLTDTQAAEISDALDGLRVKDWMTRRSSDVEALVRVGKGAEADALIDGLAATRAQKDELKEAKAQVERDIRFEESQRKAAELEAREGVKAQFYVDIWDGKAGRAQIEEAVSKGRIHPNDRPELFAALRSYQNSLESAAGMTTAQKAEWADWSMDAAMMLRTMPASQFMKGPDGWDERARLMFDNMDPDRQREIRKELIERRQRGLTSNAADGVYSDLINVARRMTPADWKLSGDSLGEGDGLAFSGELRRLAQVYAEKSGGEPINATEAREIVARALGNFGRPPMDIMLRDVAAGRGGLDKVDMVMLGRLREEMTVRMGRTPTQEELTAAYRRATGAK